MRVWRFCLWGVVGAVMRYTTKCFAGCLFVFCSLSLDFVICLLHTVFVGFSCHNSELILKYSDPSSLFFVPHHNRARDRSSGRPL